MTEPNGRARTCDDCGYCDTSKGRCRFHSLTFKQRGHKDPCARFFLSAPARDAELARAEQERLALVTDLSKFTEPEQIVAFVEKRLTMEEAMQIVEAGGGTMSCPAQLKDEGGA